jgi:hypothetical protein
MEGTEYGKYFITTTPPRPDYPQAMNKDNVGSLLLSPT